MDNATFEKFIGSLAFLIDDLKKENGVFIPSEKYIPETFRSFYICFRPFKRKYKPDEQPPFPSMLADFKACGKEAWGFALLFANIFSLVEINSKSRFECKILRTKIFKNTQFK
jgi:hypothetical protein